jgi:RimJ/RimL family protein N-acetyltransferase
MIDKKDIFIKGNNIFLKILTENDVSDSGWFSWFNDEETTRFLQHRYFPNTIENQRTFYQQNIKNTTNKIQLGIVPHSYDSIVGVVSLSNIDFLNRKAEFGIIIGESSFRGKGIGKEATSLILSHGFKKLNLNKIWLGVHSEHKQAIKCYERTGFKIDGILRDEIAESNTFYNTVNMSILAREYFSENV